MPDRLDILHINTERTWRGGEQQTLSLVKGLLRRKIACGIVCQPNTRLAHKAKQAQIPLFEIAMRGEADFKAALQIRHILLARGCKLVHTHTSHAQTLGFWASLKLNVKRLASRRVAFSIYRHDFMKINAIKYKYMTDHYVAISQNIKQALVNDGLNPAKIDVVYSGVDPLRFANVTSEDVAFLRRELGLKPYAKVILSAAQLSKEKGQDVLLAALPGVLQKYPEVKLVLAGGGDADALKRQAAVLGIANSVIFAGFREDVGLFYNLCDVFTLPSLNEGLGTAVLDAMALRKPVVVSAAGGLPEIVQNGESGRVTPVGNVAALSAALVHCFNEPQNSQNMAERGYERLLENFTLDKMVEGNLAVYKKLVTNLQEG